VPAPVYSERFFNTMAAYEWRTYVVPPEMRAIIRSVSVAWHQAPAGVVHVYVASIPLINVDVPGGTGASATETYSVAYQGEEISVYLAAPNGLYCHVSGYLFSDNSGRDGPPHSPGQLPSLPDRPPPGEER
jgi:hypothetical protein